MESIPAESKTAKALVNSSRAESGSFILRVGTPADAARPEVVRIVRRAGEEFELPFSVFLEDDGTLSERFGSPALAAAWSLGLTVENDSTVATLLEATDEETDALGFLDGGWHAAQRVDEAQAVSAYVRTLILIGGVPTTPAVSILRGRVRIRTPDSGEATVRITPASGVRGPSEVVELEVVNEEQLVFRPDVVPLTIEVRAAESNEFFVRGDSNQDAKSDIADAIFTLDWLFRGGPGSPCNDAADSNDDGAIDVSDAIFGLGCLFVGAQCPPSPFPDCTVDSEGDALECRIGGVCR